MNRRRAGIAVVAALILFTIVGPIQQAEGATGLSFLRIGPGARAVALGNAVVSQVHDASATYWNPGALGLMDGTWAEVAHNEIMQGVRYEFVSAARRIGPGGLGLSWHGVWTDRLKSYDESGEYQGEFGYYDIALSASYGFALSDKIGAGLTAEYLREVIDVYTASGLGLGVGLQAREILPRTSVGIALRHIGSQMKFEQQNFDLPFTVQGGVTYRLPVAMLNGGVHLSVEAEKVRDEDARLLIGTEYEYQNTARLEFGYRSGLDTQDISMGFGIGDKGLRGDYAFVPFAEHLGDEHRVSLSYTF